MDTDEIKALEAFAIHFLRQGFQLSTVIQYLREHTQFSWKTCTIWAHKLMLDWIHERER